MATAEFSLDESKSGYLMKTGTSYDTAYGAGNCMIEWVNADNSEKEAYFFFDTKSLPNDATITLVEFYVYLRDIQLPDPPGEQIQVGEFGDEMDSSDFNQGTSVVAGPLLNNTWYGLTNAAIQYVKKSGWTVVKIKGSFEGWFDQARYYNGRRQCKLRVTYTSPFIVEKPSIIEAPSILPDYFIVEIPSA
jgi:hypothetical protein